MTNEQLALLLEEYRLSVKGAASTVARGDTQLALDVLKLTDNRFREAIDTLLGLHRI